MDFFHYRSVHASFMSTYGNGKEHHTKTGHESFLQFVSQTRLFTDFINSSPSSANVARLLFFWTRKNTKRLPPTLDISYQLRYFRHKNQRRHAIILDGSHDFVLVSRLNFQHIHYSVFPAIVSSSFHLFQIHRLIKTRSDKNSTTFMVLL